MCYVNITDGATQLINNAPFLHAPFKKTSFYCWVLIQTPNSQREPKFRTFHHVCGSVLCILNKYPIRARQLVSYSRYSVQNKNTAYKKCKQLCLRNCLVADSFRNTQEHTFFFFCTPDPVIEHESFFFPVAADLYDPLRLASVQPD